MISRSTLYSSFGGDSVQVIETAANLRTLHTHVDIKLSNERICYSDFDILHFFNITRPADILHHARASGKPFVVSSIYVNYKQADMFSRRGAAALACRLLSNDGLEYLKAVARLVKRNDVIASPRYFIKGHRDSIRWVLRRCRMVLPNSHSEYRRLFNDYTVACPHRVVPNGINDELTQRKVTPDNSFKDCVVCASRIEGRKNQLQLIRALKNAPYRVLIIGNPSPNTHTYYRLCREEARSSTNIEFIGHCEQTRLFGILAAARVHALPSWFETTGLCSLEAAALGCGIVIADTGDQREYFGDFALYCRPDDPHSIRAAVDRAFESGGSGELRKVIRENYTWQKAAAVTRRCYEEILDKK